MATITPQAASTNGALTYAAATSGGDSLAMGTSKRVTFLVRNAGSTITVTFAGAVTCSQGSLHNVAISCAAGDTEILVPAQAITSLNAVGITYSSVTSVTVAAISHD